MSESRAARGRRLIVSLLSLSACAQRAEQTGAPPSPQASTSVVATNPSIPAPSASAPPANTARASDAAPSPVHEELSRGKLKSATIVGWSRPGVLIATLERREAKAEASVTVALALDQSPLAYRGPLAFERLAREIGARVVPAAVLRRIGTSELGALFADEKDLRHYFASHAVVQNDGTIDALLFAPSRGSGPEAWAPLGGRDITIDNSQEARSWAQKVASIDPSPDENAESSRDYVETLVLDYLSANVLRRALRYDEAAGAIHLTNNESAFPQKVDPRALDVLLTRLRPVMRFPRGLRDALLRLTRARTRALFADGPFSSWLVSPRMLVDLDERRQSLLSLIDARVAEHGAARVLTL